MRKHELLVLRRRFDLLSELACPQRAVDKRHADRLALTMPKAQPVAAREARRCRGRTNKLVDHLAFGHRDPSDRHRKAKLRRHEFQLDLTKADLTSEWMVAAITALRGIAERQQVALVATRQVLQPYVAAAGEAQRIVGEIADRHISIGRG